jgi:hypothetical protein
MAVAVRLLASMNEFVALHHILHSSGFCTSFIPSSSSSSSSQPAPFPVPDSVVSVSVAVPDLATSSASSFSTCVVSNNQQPASPMQLDDFGVSSPSLSAPTSPALSPLKVAPCGMCYVCMSVYVCVQCSSSRFCDAHCYVCAYMCV